MFGNLINLIPAASTENNGPPQNVPPPTPVHLPQCRPQASDTASLGSGPVSADTLSPELTAILHNLIRPVEQVNISHLKLLGVHVTSDVSVSDLIPDPSCLPDFEKWDGLTREQADVVDAEPRPNLCNDRPPPGASKYVDLRESLSTANDRAFRAVRRIAPRPGEQYPRLGYGRDFFACLENITAYWDDTSVVKPQNSTDEKPSNDGNEAADKTPEADGYTLYRTNAGTAMPPPLRAYLLTSFLKLVTYDFSCSVISRHPPEERLYIKSPDSTGPNYRHSYFTSGPSVSFLFRMPMNRDTAKRGIIDGPVAAVNPRHTTFFRARGPQREAAIDLLREVVAALVTAQNRAREGKKEKRIGKDAWWATKRRWGGGPGGPVGKEEDIPELNDLSPEMLGDKDVKLSNNELTVELTDSPVTKDSPLQTSAGSATLGSPTSGKYRGRSPSSGSAASTGGSSQPPNPKRPRKGLAIYDAYRMVRPPSLQWDPKTKYTAIGRQRGVDYDDVFVISCLFHHISILRVRVPDRLLQVLSGAIRDPGLEARGQVKVWRTRWHDFFLAQDRLDAMKALWAVMAYSMRKLPTTDEMAGAEDSNGKDAKKDGSSR